jgi:hypothetical protein
LIGGFIVFPWSQAAAVWRGLREVLATAPDELTVQSGLMPGLDGQPTFFLAPAWSGDLAVGEHAIDALVKTREAAGDAGGPDDLCRDARTVGRKRRGRTALGGLHTDVARVHTRDHRCARRVRADPDLAANPSTRPPLSRCIDPYP